MEPQIDVILADSNSLVISAMSEIFEKDPRFSVVATSSTAEGFLSTCLRSAGAAGFASRSGDVEGLLSTCVEVSKGKMVFPFVDVRDLQSDPIQSLSRKERVILDSLSKGLTNRELSKELGITTNTVKFHLSNLYEKLSVRNRAQAIAFYYSSRLPGERKSDPDHT